jgi:predicted nucleotidyltransferase component of viral defense system
MSETHGIWTRWIQNPNEMRTAVEFTSSTTGFQPDLVEKDFWCSVALARLFSQEAPCPLIFKGGTLLSKAYVAFNRLSEDLDFTLPVNSSSTRGARSRTAKEIKKLVASALEGWLTLDNPGWQSFNASSQHQSRWIYPSVFGGTGAIKLEIGQREPLRRSVETVQLATLLRDPMFNEEALPMFQVNGLGKEEAYAEKVRAALTRKDPAPRDLFDLDYAVENQVLLWAEEKFLDLAADKVAMESNFDWLADERINRFQKSLETELRPVLRAEQALATLVGTAPEFVAFSRALLAEARLDDALQKAATATDLDPQNPEALLQHALLLQSSGQLEKSAATLEKLVLRQFEWEKRKRKET